MQCIRDDGLVLAGGKKKPNTEQTTPGQTLLSPVHTTARIGPLKYLAMGTQTIGCLDPPRGPATCMLTAAVALRTAIAELLLQAGTDAEVVRPGMLTDCTAHCCTDLEGSRWN